MCCFFATLMFFGPRLGFLVWWLIAPLRVNLALQDFNLPWLVGILGLIFAPWTILMYTIVFPLNGFDWVWIGLAIGADLPVSPDFEVQVERLVSPRTVELQVDRKRSRRLPVAVRVEGLPAGGVVWTGDLAVEPSFVEVSGPERDVAALDSVRLDAVRIAGKRDTVQAMVRADALPDWCVMEPEQVTVSIPLEPEATRRVTLHIEPPRGAAGFTVIPERVVVTVSAPRSLLTPAAVNALRVHWTAPEPVDDFVGRRVGLKRLGDLPEGARVRLEPDSVTLQRVRR